MVFSSLFFVFLFLPLNLIIYKFVPGIKAKNIVMLVFSLIFYAWGSPLCLLLLCGMTAADWIIAIHIEKQKENGKSGKSGIAYMCLVNLGLLGIFKYGTFILSNIKYFTGFPSTIPNIVLPIGISFYTFQLISYVVDVYRGEVKAQRNYAKLLLYVSLFHQCIAGPIVRYSDVANEIEDRSVTAFDIADGIWRFCIGLAKKAVLANACGSVADGLLGADGLKNDFTVVGLWVGLIAYALQIYLDFSAYSDMAIGMGRMIGFHYLENFNYPYISRSVTEFWRRWHISLSTFFRDYIYIPLGGNRKGRIITVLNLFVVWFCTGLWHGASWNFVLWGLYFFVFLICEKFFLSKLLAKSKPAGHIYLLLAVLMGWILFRFDSLSDIGDMFKGLVGIGADRFCGIETLSQIGSNAFILIISLVASTPAARNICEILAYRVSENKMTAAVYAVGRILIPVFLLLISTAALVGDTYNPFLYFRF